MKQVIKLRVAAVRERIQKPPRPVQTGAAGTKRSAT